jgi:hypothetical protein
MSLRLVIKITVFAVSVHFLQERFGSWILWKKRPEFHTRKSLMQNSKQTFSQQIPQAPLLTPIYQNYFAKIKTLTQTTATPQSSATKLTAGLKAGRAHLHIRPANAYSGRTVRHRRNIARFVGVGGRL